MPRRKLSKQHAKRRLENARKIKEQEKLTLQDENDWRRLSYAKLRMNN